MIAALVLAAVLSAQDALELFAPDVVSGPGLFQGSFTPDGQAFHFFRRIGQGENYRLYVTRQQDGEWSPARQVESPTSDLYPSFSPDGRRMAFISYRPTPGGALARNATAIWVQGDGGRGEPQWQSAATPRDRYVSTLEHRADGSLCFRSFALDYSDLQFLCARWDGQAYGAPEPDDALRGLRGRLPEGKELGGGVMSPSGQTLILEIVSRDPATNRLTSDLWRADRQGEAWGDPRPLADEINSPLREAFPIFSPTGELYFVRDFRDYYRIGRVD